MHYEIEVNGRLKQVSVHRVDGQFVVTIDGRDWAVDAVRIDAHTWSLLVGGTVGGEHANPTTPELKLGPTGGEGVGPTFRSGATAASGIRSYEVTLTPDPATGGQIVRVDAASVAVIVNGRRRWGRRDDSVHTGASGPERLVAPMPGKIVRVLVQTGETVRARQPVVVIEAMKMENELRALGDGTVSEIHVRDGQSVEAGALLAVIHR